MWMMTSIGFYSIIERDKQIQIRARCEKDLDNLCDLMKIQEDMIYTSQSDYPWRVIISREEWERIFPKFAQLITYGNFKDMIKDTNKKREALYHQVWVLLRRIEQEDK